MRTERNTIRQSGSVSIFGKGLLFVLRLFFLTATLKAVLPSSSYKRLNNYLPILAISTSLIASPVSAYVPAIPVNDTSNLNLTDDSGLNLKWNPDAGSAGVYAASVSYQLKADVPNMGTDIGALVHFTEEEAGDNLTTSTPWIAMVECRNWSRASDYWDIFTLARDRGAVAALLYTTVAQGCLINEEYLNDFEKPLDVFSTKNRYAAQLIEAQFNATDSQYWGYNGTLLNASGTIVNESLTSDTVPSRTYLIATLVARVSDGQATSYPPNPTPTPAAAGEKSDKRKSAGMIVLYVIAGSLGLLIVSVVLIGAVRALLHPEVYGPNAELQDRTAPASTAAGIGHAILDTFPVIKFNRTPRAGGREKMEYPSYSTPMTRQPKDVEADYAESSFDASTVNHLTNVEMDSPMEDVEDKGIEMDERRGSKRPGSDSTLIGSSFSANYKTEISPPVSPSKYGQVAVNQRDTAASKDPEIAAAAKAFAEQRRSLILNQMKRRSAEPTAEINAVAGPSLPSSPKLKDVGRVPEVDEADEEEEVCPICLLEFEEGDDVRMLPCQLAHSFHKECIDPWLLEVSSSCPLCRKDFAAAANQSRVEVDESHAITPPTTATENDARPGRFGRYLAFVRRERRRNHDDEEINGETRRARRQRRREERWEQSGPGGY